MNLFISSNFIKKLLFFSIIGTFLFLYGFAYILNEVGPKKYYFKHNTVGTQMLKIKGGLVRIQVSDGNPSNAILFLHGFNGFLENWTRVWRETLHCGELIRLDIPGFGLSTGFKRDFSLPKQSARIIEILNKLGIERVHVVGTSMGGSLAVWLAAKYPERVDGLTLLAPSAYPGALHLSRGLTIIHDVPLIFHLAIWISGLDLYHWLFPKSRMNQSLSDLTDYGQPWLKQLAKIKQPVDLVWSKSDKTVDFSSAALIMKRLKNAKFTEASETAGHNITGTVKDSELVAHLICQAVQRPNAAQSR